MGLFESRLSVPQLAQLRACFFCSLYLSGIDASSQFLSQQLICFADPQPQLVEVADGVLRSAHPHCLFFEVAFVAHCCIFWFLMEAFLRIRVKGCLDDAQQSALSGFDDCRWLDLLPLTLSRLSCVLMILRLQSWLSRVLCLDCQLRRCA